MPKRRAVSVKVLKAVSSPIRMRILNLLFNRGHLSYTEIMNLLRLRPSRDAGRFAYHLKLLLKMDLIEPDAETKKYRLTDLGRRLVEVAEEIEESAHEKRRMLVRTSRLSIEYFDRNKIAESLIREAGVPADLAQRIARETERRLLKLKVKYLTAPLIREFVNAILIERGLEDYRHKLTRLGLPVYDVTEMMKSISMEFSNVEKVLEAAGNSVMEEYTLLNILPRDIADAHISGILNLNDLGCWILKPSGFRHDIRFLFRYGLSFKGYGPMKISYQPPKSLNSALLLILEALRLAADELSNEETIDYFNIFLAPYVKGLEPEYIKEQLKSFLMGINHIIPVGVSIGLELSTPGFLNEANAFGPNGKVEGVYSEFTEESQLVASLLLDVILDGEESKPIFNPSVIIKVRPEALGDGEAESLLYKAHQAAIEKGVPYFANLTFKGQRYASYTATGLRLTPEWSGDWELDTLRTGGLGSVIINLPRALYDSGGDRGRLLRNLYERVEMAMRALQIKYMTIRQRVGEGLLPFLTQRGEEDPYYRIENSIRLISFVGLNEAVQSLTGEAIYESEGSLKAAKDMVNYMSRAVQGLSKRFKGRFALSMVPSEEAARRLAELDVEMYGLAKVSLGGGGKSPSYTTMSATPLDVDLPLEDYLRVESTFHALTPGCHLAVIPIDNGEQKADDLLMITESILKRYKIGLYAFNRKLAYCDVCRKVFYGDLSKCPSCGSVKAVTYFARSPAKYSARPLGG